MEVLRESRCTILGVEGVEGATRRGRRIETLESRCLLVAEGDVFEISRVFDTTGTAGALTSTIHWGDGTSSPGTVVGSQANGPLRVRFVYDNNDPFFNGANAGRRQRLQAAADAIINRFTDSLTAIQPSGFLQWSAITVNPRTGQQQSLPNLSVAANELVVYAGARNLGGNRVGEGNPGLYSFPPVSGLTPQQLNQLQSFRDNVMTRGKTGVTGNAPTNYATWGGSVAFDTGTPYYFGADQAGLGTNQVDFFSVASHELLHVLGFGVQFVGTTSSWQHLTRNGTYLGVRGNAAYPGSGSIPLHSDLQHFSMDARYQGKPLLMNPLLSRGQRYQLSPVEMAVMADIGWSVAPSSVTVTAQHVYPDNGSYPIEVILAGSTFGTLTQTLSVNVTNVPPSLDVPAPQTVFAGETLTITNLGRISDPGFRNPHADPPTAETFTYAIDWRDGSEIVRGEATIDRHGTANPQITTLASFDGSHVYDAPGVYHVQVTVADDDGGTSTATFPVNVLARPQLTLTLDRTTIRESDGPAAAVLTVRRSGPALSTDQTILLSSSDESEAVVPPSVVIRAGETSASVFVDAVDDDLLDGTQTVILRATGQNLLAGEIAFNVTDHETLSAQLSANEIFENQPGSVTLTLTRSNTDIDQPLAITILGRQGQIDIDGVVTIPANQNSVVIPLVPFDDDEPEPPIRLRYTFIATGYTSAEVEFTLIDDEPPLFQNPINRYDINGDGEVTAADAIRGINELSRRAGSDTFLDPKTQQPKGVYFDVNGDYHFTALDVLIVINHLSRMATQTSLPSPELEEDEETAAVDLRALVFSQLGLNDRLDR